MISFKSFLYIFAAGASIFFILNDTIISRGTPSDFEQVLETEEPPFSNLFNATDPPDIQKQCVLPKLDPWDPTIKQFFDTHKNPKSNCQLKFKRRSFIDLSGILRVNESTENLDEERCFYRCLFAVDDRNLRFGNWTQVDWKEGAQPQCDVFDVQCSLGAVVTYKFLHSQIYEDKEPPKVKAVENAPDVHVIVVDSVSMSQFFRSMPTTTHYLRNEMDAVIFPYLNKVGLNSRPNAYGFLMGERAEILPPNPWGKGNSHGRSNELCQHALDKENFIIFDYQKRGYRTMMNEDWAIGIFNWPACRGFSKKPADHFMKPFALRFDGSKQYKDKELRDALYAKSCMERHDYMLDVLEEYINKYPTQPKFSLSWLTNLAHDDANGLYHVDEQFREFFERMKPKLNNSFFILMGDHGGRTGNVRQTLVGELEDSNPFFIMMVPEHLRGNSDISNQLYRNSKEIITHYDLYSTFLEIAKNSPGWTRETKLTGQFEYSNRTLIGSSLFRTLKQPRTCDSLQIPFQYCICQHKYTLINDSEISFQIAELVVAIMNEEVAKSKYNDKCAEIFVDKEKTSKLQLQEFEPQGNRRIFRGSLRVFPSGGLYDAFAEYRDGKASLITKRFPRHDVYASQTKCIPEDFIRNYCYCKDLLKT